MAVYDQDGAAPAREFIARFRGAPAFEEVARLTHESQIAQFIDISIDEAAPMLLLPLGLALRQ